MSRAGTIVSFLVGLAAIAVGLLLSPAATQTGIFRWIPLFNRALIGVIPAFSPSPESWGYTYEKLSRADLRGQVALITGANSGIGFETAKALSKLGASVHLACRNPQKCFQAADRIRTDEKYSGAPLTPMIVDVSSLKSVRSASRNFLKHNDRLDMLFLNAGIISVGTNDDGTLPLSKDGVEMVFATNVLGHHLMYKLLEPALQNSTMARVALTSSLSSFDSYGYKVATDLDTLNGAKSSVFHFFRVYGHSKLAQIVWAKALAQKLGEESNIYVNSMNPGAVRTELLNKNPYFPQFLTDLKSWVEERLIWTVEEGALTLLYLGVATEEIKEKNIRGKYFHPQAVEVINPLSLDEALQDKLWTFCDDLVKGFLDENVKST